MARRPTSAEAFQLRQWFPVLNVGSVWVLGEATPYRPPYTQYNCLAWSLGITDRWVWPWGSRNATDAEMTAFLRTHGFVRAASPTRVSYGFSASAVGHIARRYNDSWGWTSKLGQWLLITHDRDALAGGYGARRLFYARAAAAATPALKETEMIEPAAEDQATLPNDDRARLSGVVGTVDAALVSAFNMEWEAWSSELSSSEVIDSSTAWLVALPSYRRLVAIGPDALPLVMDRIAEGQWYAVLVADALLPIEQQVTIAVDDPAVLEGEQGRAWQSMLLWLDSQS